MDDDVEEVGAMLPVEVLMKSSFPRRRRQGDCCSCCCFYRLLRRPSCSSNQDIFVFFISIP